MNDSLLKSSTLPAARACRIDWAEPAAGAAAPSYGWIATPLGRVLLVAERDALTGLYFEGQRRMPQIGAGWTEAPGHTVLDAARRQLEQYWAGERLGFELPLRLRGTRFQRAVWQAIAAIAPGRSSSYRALATAAGNPAAVRAAGAATGRNPLCLIVPCHRVLGSDGAITGYAGGLHRKRALLAFEAAEGAGQRRAALAELAAASGRVLRASPA